MTTATTPDEFVTINQVDDLADVPNVSAGGVTPEIMANHQPLTNTELRDLYVKVGEIHAILSELRAVKDRMPEFVENMPPMFRGMFRSLV